MKKKIIIIFVIIIIIFYGILIFLGRKIQNFSTFPRVGYEKININGVEKINLKNGKNKIIGIYLNNNKKKTIFYFHGNGGNLNMFENQIKNIGKLGYNVISYDYPGYGESEGSPTEDSIYKSSEIFYNYLINELKIDGNNIIIYGYSIGAAIAIDLAYKKDVDKLILMSPFTSRYGMGKYLLGFNLQKKIFLKNSFISEEKIKKIKEETLVIHGKQDKLIPVYMGEKIYENSGANKKFLIIIDKAGHNNISYQFNKKINPYIIDFIEGKKIPKKILIR